MTDLQSYFIYCSRDGITTRNLTNRMYFFLLLDKQFIFRYSLNSKGIFSNPMSNAINEMIAMDYLEVRDGLIYPSQQADNLFEDRGMLITDKEKLDKLKEMLDNLTDLELEEGIATHLMIEDYSKKYGWINFKEYTSDLIKTIQGLYSDYNRKVLNKVVKVINYVEGTDL